MNRHPTLTFAGTAPSGRFFYSAILPLLLCAGLTVVLWTIVLSKLDQDRIRAEQSVRNDAASYAASYAAHIARIVTQIDQLTLHLKFHSEHASGILDLEAQQKAGLFPPASLLYASIIDRNGYRLSSTLPDRSQHHSVAGKDYFQLHQHDASPGLQITPPIKGLNSGKPLLRFSRRIDTSSKEFKGVALVSVEPSYVAALIDEAKLGGTGHLSLVRSDGLVLAERRGNAAFSPPDSFLPSAMRHAEKGVKEVVRADSKGEQTHVVAWEKIADYPLFALASLPKQELLRDYHAHATAYRRMAVIGTLFLLLAGAAGALLAFRLAVRKRQTSEIQKTYLLATEGAREGFYMLRAVYDGKREVRDFVIEDCNQRGAALYGLSKQDVIGKKLSGFGEICAQQSMEIFLRAMETGFHEDEFKGSATDSSSAVWMQRRIVRSGRGLAVTLRDISELKAHEALLSRLAHGDPLTGLPNRHWIMQYLPLAIERAAAQQSILALLFIDLDNFKDVNDSSGHAAGDEVLKLAAARLQSAVREKDHVVRLGGDEFTIILESTDGHAHVAPLAERIVQALNEPFTLRGNQHYSVRGSVGISLYPQDGTNGEVLLQHADTAMYAAKAAGKGQYRFYQPSLSENLMTLMKAKQELNSAIELGEFVLYYQPRVNALSGELCGLEALARWKHPERGLVGPQDFIRLAEDNHLIAQLGEFVIHAVFSQLTQWQGEGLRLVPVSINIASSQLSHGNVAAVLSTCLRTYAIEPRLIGVEISECCTMAESGHVRNELRAIDRLGIRLLVDNFGSGHSSMVELHALNIAALKIDRSVTARLCRDHHGDAYCMAILSMAHVLGMGVVAEGVETIEQLQALQALSCNEVQGFAISAPVPAEEVPALLRKRYVFPSSMRMRADSRATLPVYSELGYT